ncbi:MAG: QueT transporter family protein [Candidatus Bathyarchaeia archaeon]
MKIKTKDIALTSIFASLYAVLVYVFAPMSFYALQFRVAGVLRPAIAKKWVLSIGYAIGVVVGNLFSPFSGPYELIFMPLVSLAAGVIGFVVAKKFKKSYFVEGAVIAVIVPIGVSWMLNQLFGLPLLATFPYLLISEQIVCLIGAFVFTLIELRFKWWE